MPPAIDYSPRASIGLVKRIPGGYLQRGSRFHPRELPSRQRSKLITVAEFDLAHVPVTVSQYHIFLLCEAYQQQAYWGPDGWAWLQGELNGWGRENRYLPDGWAAQQNRQHRPVVGVCWYEARAYCAWLSAIKRRRVRLPSEDEWEYAARSDDGRPFPWGEDFDASLTNTLESERLDTVDAGSIPGDISPFGIMDMAGNVQEWTSSVYRPQIDEAFPPGALYAARGGGYNDTAYAARTSYRRAYPPGYFFPFLGFRVAVERI